MFLTVSHCFSLYFQQHCSHVPQQHPTPRSELRGAFPTKPWTDVLSKADLLEEEFDAADSLAQQPTPPTHDGAEGALGVFRGAPGTVEAMAGAVQVAAMLPDAVRVSSMRGDGLDELQACILDMCEAAKEEAAV